MTAAIEIELKLEYRRADRERLVAALRALCAADATQQLVSTYFDTPGHELARAGYTLRVRRKGRAHIQTVKAAAAAAGLFARSEWEHPVRGEQPYFDERSGPLAEAVGADVLGRIAPLFVTEVRRRLFRFESADGAVEVALDEGEVRAGARREPLCELELELREGAPRTLFDLARALNEAVPLRLGVSAKAERGYALAEGAPRTAVKAAPVVLDAKGEAAEAFAIVARACIRQFRMNEILLARSGDAEALHQARVGLRRLRSALSICAPLFEGDLRVAWLSAQLRWLAAALGKVRNLDVLIPRCDDDARALLAAARERAFGQVRALLTGGRTRLLMIDLAEWLELGDWRARPRHPHRLHRSVTAFAGDILEARRDRLVRRSRGLCRLDNAHRHQARIDAKKLRYAAEFFGSLYAGDKAVRRHRKFVAALEALQEQLGELNDLAVGQRTLEELGIDATLAKSGKRRRERLIGRAADARRALLRAKRFW